MLIVRYLDGEIARLGIIEGDQVRAAGGELFGHLLPEERIGPISTLRLLPPVVPGKIVAVSPNYADHFVGSQAALAEPTIFLKPPSAIIGHGDRIVLPPGAGTVHHEAELAVVIGRTARGVPRARAYEHILGLTCANDVTALEAFGQDSQDRQWLRAKGFDTFCPLGPAIATNLRADALAIESRLNGEVKQASSTARLLFDVPLLVEFISAIMTLLPGDVILTGTPPGDGPLRLGDRIEVEIEGIGTLANDVAASVEGAAED